MSSRPDQSASLLNILEQLEQRRLFADVYGTSGNDIIDMYLDGNGGVVVQVNFGTPQDIPGYDLPLNVHADDGDDLIFVDSAPDDTNIDCGDGNDLVNVFGGIETNDAYLGSVISHLAIQGGGGNDQVNVGTWHSLIGLNSYYDTYMDLDEPDVDFDGGEGSDSLTIDDGDGGARTTAVATIYDIIPGYTIVNSKWSEYTVAHVIEESNIEQETLKMSSANGPDVSYFNETLNVTGTDVPVKVYAGNTPFSSDYLPNYLNINDTGVGAPVTIEPNLANDIVTVGDGANDSATAIFAPTFTDGSGTYLPILGSLDIGSDGTAVLGVGNSQILRTEALSIDSGGTLDINNAAMILEYSGTSPAGSIRSLITTGRNSGAWTGTGITSSVAAANSTGGSGYAVGYGDGADSIVSGLSSGEILIKFTLAADADLSGAVDNADLTRIALHWASSAGKWTDGDFTYDGNDNISDLLFYANNYNLSIDPGL